MDGLDTLRLLKAIRFLDLEKKTRFYQASTSELYGLVKESPQNENTPFHPPRSPYGVAKLYAYWITVNYREAYGIYTCNGILFNHESARRGETFITRKVTRGLANIATGLEPCLYIGNLNAARDWGHDKDYVEMQYLMLQQDTPEHYVFATDKQLSVRDFINTASTALGATLSWPGNGTEETATVTDVDASKINSETHIKLGDVIVCVDKNYYRPAEVDSLLGDASKARQNLGWQPKIGLQTMVAEMLMRDLDKSKQNALLRSRGYDVNTPQE